MSFVSLAAYAGSGGGGGFYTQLQNLQRETLVYMVSGYHVVAKRNGKKSTFSVYKLGFGLITASGLRIKEFPLYGMNKYYKMVGKKIIAEGFLPGREISVSENSAAGDIHCICINECRA